MNKTDDSFFVTNKTKGKLPSLPFYRIKNAILGRRYILSVVVIGDKRSRTLNRVYRKKDAVANVLSFPLQKTEGELFLNLRQAHRDTLRFRDKYETLVGRLFIHGLLHLKGHTHGSRMETIEKRLQYRFKL